MRNRNSEVSLPIIIILVMFSNPALSAEPVAMDIKNDGVNSQGTANELCPNTCSGMIWNGQFAPEPGVSNSMVCGTENGYDIPVGYFNGQAGANKVCQLQISKVEWNGQWLPSICGCQPPPPIPGP